MNALGLVAIWLAAQVTVVGLAAALCYLAVRRDPAARAFLVTLSLVVLLGLFVAGFAPWPRWWIVGAAAAPGVEPGVDRLPAAARVAGGDARGEASQPDATESAETAAGPAATATKADLRSASAAFWRTFWSELSAPAPTPENKPAWWPAAIGIAFAVAAAIGAGRLACGLLAVRRLRATSVPVVDAELANEIAWLSRKFGCPRPCEVRSSAELSAPVTVGWRRPLVLVPVEWPSWSAAERRAALAHEVAHVRRGDYATGILAQLSLAAHYYHPLVHWLVRRLRQEQELVADAAAAAATDGRQEYLATLARLALRYDDRRIAWAARPFLPTRGAFLRRIDMLRDPNSWRRRPLPRWMNIVLATLVCAAGLVVTGVRGPHDASGVARAAVADQAQASPSDAEAFSLTHVPDHANMVLAIRPASLLKLEALRSSTGLLNNDLRLQATLGMPVEEVEQLLVIIYDLGRVRFVVKAQKPIDQRKFHSADVPEATAETVAGVTLYAAKGAPPSALAYYFADERTVVFDTSAALHEHVAKSPRSAPGWAGQWKSVAAEDAAIVVDVKSIRPMLAEVINQSRVQQGDAAGAFRTFVAPFAVLWEQTDLAVAGGIVRDGVKLHATAQCLSAEGAQQVQKTLEALVTLFLNSVPTLRGLATGAPAGAEKEVAARMALVEAVEKLLKDVKITQKGTTVEATTHAPASILTVATVLAPAGLAAREAAQRAQAQNNMKQLMLAMHNYHDKYAKFPAAAPLGKDGKTPHSWRIDLLPFLELRAKGLYDEYRFDEPWDSESNRKVLAQMPAVFRAPQDDPKSTNAAYFAVTGPAAALSEREGTSIRDFTDGTSNTIMLVEAKRDIPWTKPEDIPFDAEKDLPKLGGWTKDGFIAAFADGSVRFVSEAVDVGVLKKLFTKAGREVVQLPQ
ncbi:MAG: DUF1559 domain-containing protein [Planctomycetia bacterium]|nr:DUF1559 domain-containing protein [Planctomycetia bacterium]